MSRQTHRTCVRMSEKEYQRLKRRSGASRLSGQRLADGGVGAKLPHPLPGGADQGGHPIHGRGGPGHQCHAREFQQRRWQHRRNCGSLWNVWPRW